MTTDDRSPPVRTNEVVVVEVPLLGDDDTRGTATSSSADSPPWRRAVAAGLVGGAALGVVVAAILTQGDDDPGAGASTTVADALAAQITTPPTLPPPATRPAAEPRTRGTTGGPGWDPYSGVDLPTYPPVTDVGVADLAGFDVAEAVTRLGEDRARRSETRLELGTAGYVVDVVIERDPVQDRYRVVLDARGDVREAIIDVAGGRTVFTDDDGTVYEQSNEELLADLGTETVNEFFDALLVGPLRPETFDPAATRGRRLVTVDDVRVAREFATAIAGDAVPEWQLYAFGPVFEFRVEDRPSLLEYSVYVSEEDDVVRIDGLSLVGDVPQLVSHRITEPTGGIRIELPVP